MRFNKSRFSDYGHASIQPAPVNEMMAAFAEDFRDGTDINLGVGYVNEKTIPTDAVAQAMQAVLTQREKYRQPLNYGGARGAGNLVRALREFYLRHGFGGLDATTLDHRRTIVGCSGATSLLDAFSDVLERGIVVTADPMYYIYCNVLERKGCEVLAVPEDAEGVRTDLLAARVEALGERKKDIAFFYFVTVNNPTCSLLSNERRAELVALATRLSEELGRAVPLIVDAAYEFLLHDESLEPPVSCMTLDTAGVVYEIGTLSKLLAPALRIGYAMGPHGALMDVLAQRTSDMGFSAPLLNQEAASWLLENEVDAQLARVNRAYREKAVFVRAAIITELDEFLEELSGGSAGFYYYLTFNNIETHPDSPFFHYLARTTGEESIDGPLNARRPRVVYIPGSYCVHPRGTMVEEGKRQLRLSYGYESIENIQAAVKLLREAAGYARRC